MEGLGRDDDWRRKRYGLSCTVEGGVSFSGTVRWEQRRPARCRHMHIQYHTHPYKIKNACMYTYGMLPRWVLNPMHCGPYTERERERIRRAALLCHKGQACQDSAKRGYGLRRVGIQSFCCGVWHLRFTIVIGKSGKKGRTFGMYEDALWRGLARDISYVMRKFGVRATQH